MINMRSVIDINDLSTKEIEELIAVAEDIISYPEKYSHKCDGKKLATLFFEPSTRTRLSFEAAMYELGGNVLSMSDAGSSSASKGESVADTAKTTTKTVTGRLVKVTVVTLKRQRLSIALASPL